MEPKIGNLLRSRDGNIIKKEWRARPTEFKGEEGTLGPIYLYSPSLGPSLNEGQLLLEGLRSDFRVGIIREYAYVISKGS